MKSTFQEGDYMNDLSNLSRDELFGVLLCGEKPKEGISLNEYMEEWNVRVKKEGGYEVTVPPVEAR